MTIPEIIAVSAACSSLLATIWVAAVKLARVEVKVDTMWNFLVRRAEAELLGKGLGTRDSPLILTAEGKQQARAYLAGIAGDLQALGQQMGHCLSDPELMLVIEGRFGAYLVEHVCVPLHLEKGACLYLALDVAKNERAAPVS